MTVLTDAISIVLYASWFVSVFGFVFIHTKAMMAATNRAHSHSQLPGAIALFAALATSSHRGAMARHAARITRHHTTAPPLLSSGRTSGIHRQRNRSGSQIGMRGNRMF